jgi:hypothetical protein
MEAQKKSVQTTMVKKTREAKRNSAIGVISMNMAKQNDDIQWRKANKYKQLFVAAKQAILKKYGNKAKAEWYKRS